MKLVFIHFMYVVVVEYVYSSVSSEVPVLLLKEEEERVRQQCFYFFAEEPLASASLRLSEPRLPLTGHVLCYVSRGSDSRAFIASLIYSRIVL